MIEPTNGTKRMSPARMPQSTALGTPMSQSPAPMNTPKPALRMVCIRKKRLNREAASSSAAVLRCRSAVPASRRNRSRMSSRCKQDEHQEEYRERGGRQGRQQWPDDVGDGIEALRLGLPHLDQQGLLTRCRCRRRRRLRDFVLQVFQSVGGPLQRARHQRSAAQRSYLGAQVGLVLRKLFGELRHLENDGRAERGYDGDREQDGDDDRGNAPQAPAAQPSDERRQNEAQQCRNDERLEDLPAHIKKDNDERRDDEAARQVAEAMSGHSRRSQTEPVHFYCLDTGTGFGPPVTSAAMCL